MGKMLKYTICQRNRARGDTTWYGRTFDTDTKAVHYVSLGTNLKRLADEWLRQHIASEVAGVGRGIDMSLQVALDSFLKQYEKRPTGKQYAYIMEHLKVYAAENNLHRIGDLTPSHCVTMFEGCGYAKASTRRVWLTMFRSFYRWCKTVYGIGGDNPFAVVKVEKPEPPDRSFWTTEQLGQILDATEDKDERLVYALMGYAGLRIHEAMKVRGEDFHDGKIFILGKGKKFASVPISRRLRAELDRYGELPQGRIVPWINSISAYHNRLNRLFREHPELDFGGRVHLHRFRHSFASNLVRAGVSLAIVMKAMRHSSIAMTMRYAHLLPDDIADALDKA